MSSTTFTGPILSAIGAGVPGTAPCSRCASYSSVFQGLCLSCYAQQQPVQSPGLGLAPLSPPQPGQIHHFPNPQEPDSEWFKRYVQARAENNQLRKRLEVAEGRLSVIEQRLLDIERSQHGETGG